MSTPCHHQSICFLKIVNFVTRTEFNTGKKNIKPSLIAKFDAERNILKNARIKDPSLYNETKDLDLIATEFKYHDVPCYRDLSRSIDNIKESVQQYEKGDFAQVEKFIMENIIKGHQVVSLKGLHEIYNLGDEDMR